MAQLVNQTAANVDYLNLVKLQTKNTNSSKLAFKDSFDSPIGQYYAGTKYSVNAFRLRYSANSSQDTIDTPTASLQSPISSAKNSMLSAKSQKNLTRLNKNEVYSFSDELKKLDNPNISRKRQLENKQLKRSSFLTPRCNDIKEQKSEVCESSDEEEYSIWDNSQAENIGIDCENFFNKEGKELTFYQLYRVRQQFYQKKHMPSHITIDEVYTIADHYKQTIRKTELVKQQEYLEQTYFNSLSTPANKQLLVTSPKQITSLQQKQEDVTNPKNPFKKRYLVPSKSIDQFEKFNITTFRKKSIKNIDYIVEKKIVTSPSSYYLNQKKIPQNLSHSNSVKYCDLQSQKIFSMKTLFSNSSRNIAHEQDDALNSYRIKTEQSESTPLKPIKNIRNIFTLAKAGYNQQQSLNNHHLVNTSTNQKQQFSKTSTQSPLSLDQCKKLIHQKVAAQFQLENTKKLKKSIYQCKSSKDLEASLDQNQNYQLNNSSSLVYNDNINTKYQQNTQYQPSYFEIAKFKI